MKECQNPCYGLSPVYHDWTVKRAIVDFPIKVKGNSKRTFGNSIVEGDIGGYPIPLYHTKKGQILKYHVENGRNTDTTFQ